MQPNKWTSIFLFLFENTAGALLTPFFFSPHRFRNTKRPSRMNERGRFDLIYVAGGSRCARQVGRTVMEGGRGRRIARRARPKPPNAGRETRSQPRKPAGSFVSAIQRQDKLLPSYTHPSSSLSSLSHTPFYSLSLVSHGLPPPTKRQPTRGSERKG